MSRIINNINVMRLEKYLKCAKKYYYLKRYKLSLKYYLRSHRLLKSQSANRLIHIVTLNNIGELYRKLLNYRKSIHYLELAKTENQQPFLEMDYFIRRNLANLYMDMNNSVKVIEYLTEVKGYNLSLKDKAQISLQLSISYRNLEDFDRANYFIDEAIGFIRDIDSYYLGYCFINKAKVSYDTGEYQNALHYLEKAEAIYSAYPVPLRQLIELYYLLEITCFELGYYDTAMFYSSKNREINV